MKEGEVPQDASAIFHGQRKAMYALGPDGRYTTVASSGWQVEETVTLAAGDEYRRMAAEARTKVEAGLAAPLEFHMYDRRMDVPMLAETARTWQWRVKRHLRPKVFARLPPAWISRYADALGLSPDALRSLPSA